MIMATLIGYNIMVMDRFEYKKKKKYNIGCGVDAYILVCVRGT
jgi:hypothetical protein